MGMLANTQYYSLLKRLVTSSDVGWAGRIGLTASWRANHLVCPEILYPPESQWFHVRYHALGGVELAFGRHIMV